MELAKEKAIELANKAHAKGKEMANGLKNMLKWFICEKSKIVILRFNFIRRNSTLSKDKFFAEFFS